MTQKSRPKVLVFLSLWWDVVGCNGWAVGVAMDFEACKGTSKKGEYEGHGCGWLPIRGGRAGSRVGTRGFPAGVEAGGFTSP